MSREFAGGLPNVALEWNCQTAITVGVTDPDVESLDSVEDEIREWLDEGKTLAAWLSVITRHAAFSARAEGFRQAITRMIETRRPKLTIWAMAHATGLTRSQFPSGTAPEVALKLGKRAQEFREEVQRVSASLEDATPTKSSEAELLALLNAGEPIGDTLATLTRKAATQARLEGYRDAAAALLEGSQAEDDGMGVSLRRWYAGDPWRGRTEDCEDVRTEKTGIRSIGGQNPSRAWGEAAAVESARRSSTGEDAEAKLSSGTSEGLILAHCDFMKILLLLLLSVPSAFADYISRGADLDGNANSKVGLVSFWFKSAAGKGGYVMGNHGQRFTVAVGETITIQGVQTDSAKDAVKLIASTDYRDNNWHHVMASWEGSTGAKHLYVDGVDALNAGISTVANANTWFARPDWTIGSRGDDFAKFNGQLSEIYFANEFLDLSDSGNRAAFYSAGNPVDLGVDGSLPTGASPLIYIRNWSGNYNSGMGGPFSRNDVGSRVRRNLAYLRLRRDLAFLRAYGCSDREMMRGLVPQNIQKHTRLPKDKQHPYVLPAFVLPETVQRQPRKIKYTVEADQLDRGLNLLATWLQGTNYPGPSAAARKRGNLWVPPRQPSP